MYQPVLLPYVGADREAVPFVAGVGPVPHARRLQTLRHLVLFLLALHHDLFKDIFLLKSFITDFYM